MKIYIYIPYIYMYVFMVKNFKHRCEKPLEALTVRCIKVFLKHTICNGNVLVTRINQTPSFMSSPQIGKQAAVFAQLAESG